MPLLAATSAGVIVAAISAGAAVGTFFAYLYMIRKASINAAREEALALAETRGEIIADLEARLESLERRHGDSEEVRRANSRARRGPWEVRSAGAVGSHAHFSSFAGLSSAGVNGPASTPKEASEGPCREPRSHTRARLPFSRLAR